MNEAAALPSTAEALLRTVVALAVVCALAWLVLRAMARRGIGTGRLGARRARRLEIEERVALDARRGVAIVSADGRRFLVGVADGGLTLLAELGPPEAAAPPPEAAEAAGDGV